MPVFKGTIEIGRPVEEVFAYLGEPKNDPEWHSDIEVKEMTSEGPMGVGSKGRMVDNYFGRDESVWEVMEWNPNQPAVIKVESDNAIGEAEWRTEPTNGGTRLTYRVSAGPKNPFFKLLIPLMIMIVRPKVKKAYQKLKEILESRS